MLVGRSVLNSDCSKNVMVPKGFCGPLCLGDTQSQGRETDRQIGGGGLRKRRGCDSIFGMAAMPMPLWCYSNLQDYSLALLILTIIV